MTRRLCILLLMWLSAVLSACGDGTTPPPAPLQPVLDLLERIDPGASRKFVLEYADAEDEFFEIGFAGDKVVIRGSGNVAIATGIHWYLKYCAGIHLSWDGMSAVLPEVLPLPAEKQTRRATVENRYAYNYCTFSYSMSFWDWERWEREIDWMALHGINRPLVAVGMEKVWWNILHRLGYSDEETDRFIAGPAWQAWWLMDNIEGWGNPSPEGWYDDRAELAKKIICRMRELGIEPVLPGYSGKMPSDAREKLGLDVVETGLWCGYRRPSFLKPEDPRFAGIADLYYEELRALYGDVKYYSCDPFHEGGTSKGVDLAASGRAILEAMKRSNEEAVWVVQAWQANPRRQMIEGLPQGDLLILDLFSESRPQWGEPSSEWCRRDGFGDHRWIYCMLLNFGGNVGLHGKLDYVVEGFYDAAEHPAAGRTLAGTGLTAEGIENNPVMFELLTELAWREERFAAEEWLDGYIAARYGRYDETVAQAWHLLARSVYGCPKGNTQEGTCESVFCSRPSFNFRGVSSWAHSQEYYDPQDVMEAARLMLSAAERFEGCSHFEYDLADIVRQAVAESGKMQLQRVKEAFDARDRELYRTQYRRFLDLIMLQDELLGTRREFMLGSYLEDARALGRTVEDKARLEWCAKTLITTWGDRNASERGGLHDYAHREWNGILATLYHERWRLWFEAQERRLQGLRAEPVDLFDMESSWAAEHREFASEPAGSTIRAAAKAYEAIRN